MERQAQVVSGVLSLVSTTPAINSPSVLLTLAINLSPVSSTMGRIHVLFITGVNDIGDKLITGDNNTNQEYLREGSLKFRMAVT